MSYDAEVGYKLRQELKDGLNVESELPTYGWGRHGVHLLVGNGTQTNAKCNKFFSWYGCVNPKHGVMHFDGKRYEGKVFVKPVFHSCDRPLCPKCYRFGWAPKEAGKIEKRLAEAEKRFGKADHIIVGVPPEDYGLDLDVLRRKVVGDILRPRGVNGGVLIFHGFRFANRREAMVKGVPFGWRWSPHWHCIGFIDGGYGHCRGCKDFPRKCRGCNGFEGITRRLNKVDGYIVKVKEARKSVFRTALYQLSHASVRTDRKRCTAVCWFGTCSYRRLKFVAKRRKSICPICGDELVRLRYFGDKSFVLDRDSPDFQSSFIDDLYDEHGEQVWVERDGGS